MNTPVNFEIAKLLKEKGFDINVGTAFKYTFEDGHIEDEYMNVLSGKEKKIQLHIFKSLKKYIWINLCR